MQRYRKKPTQTDKLLDTTRYFNKKIQLCRNNTVNTYLYKRYGFVPNPSLPPWENYKIHLGKTPLKIYFNRITNKDYHNLCRSTQPPSNAGKLLGLGLNFCVQKRNVDPTTTNTTMERLRRDTRLKFIFAETSDPEFEEDYAIYKKLYIKSDWPSPPAFKNVEDRLVAIENLLIKERKSKFIH